MFKRLLLLTNISLSSLTLYSRTKATPPSSQKSTETQREDDSSTESDVSEETLREALEKIRRPKYLSLSFDDAPREDTFLSGKERSERLIRQLKEHYAQAVFYANSANLINPEALERLKNYQKAGHLIGNHTQNHLSLEKVLPEVFFQDFMACHKVLKDFGFEPKYFRYPFLHRGNDKGLIHTMREKILSNGYNDGFVTLINYDFYMDRLFQEAVGRNLHSIDWNQLKEFYVTILTLTIEHYEELAKEVYPNHPVKHVLLLHENDLAAFFLGDLLTELKRKSWILCSPEESYSDPQLIRFPGTVTRHGQGRLIAHATEALKQGRDIVFDEKELLSGFEDEKHLTQVWRNYKIEKPLPSK